jgi:hypothetical protein
MVGIGHNVGMVAPRRLPSTATVAARIVRDLRRDGRLTEVGEVIVPTLLQTSRLLDDCNALGSDVSAVGRARVVTELRQLLAALGREVKPIVQTDKWAEWERQTAATEAAEEARANRVAAQRAEAEAAGRVEAFDRAALLDYEASLEAEYWESVEANRMLKKSEADRLLAEIEGRAARPSDDQPAA